MFTDFASSAMVKPNLNNKISRRATPSRVQRELARRFPRTAWRLRLVQMTIVLSSRSLILRRQDLIALFRFDRAVRSKLRR